jgi:hypothetical protein
MLTEDRQRALQAISVAAADWQAPEKLTRLCTIPVNEILQARWDTGSLVMEARILRPLLWFGLLDHRSEKAPGARFAERHFYRKAPLFDRFFSSSMSALSNPSRCGTDHTMSALQPSADVSRGRPHFGKAPFAEVGRLTKPFSTEERARKICRILDGRPRKVSRAAPP